MMLSIFRYHLNCKPCETNLHEAEVLLPAPGQDVQVHVVPVVVLELLIREVGPRHIIGPRVGHLEAVRVVDAFLRVRVSTRQWERYNR